jgi:hypothetical protein
MAKVDTFLKNGGSIIFDTRDAGGFTPSGFGADTAENRKLREILAFVTCRRSSGAAPTMCLHKAFYLLSGFPGRWDISELWVESMSDAPPTRAAGARRRRGIADHHHRQRPRRPPGPSMPAGLALPTVPPTPRQRELAFRAGVNIVSIR